MDRELRTRNPDDKCRDCARNPDDICRDCARNPDDICWDCARNPDDKCRDYARNPDDICRDYARNKKQVTRNYFLYIAIACKHTIFHWPFLSFSSTRTSEVSSRSMSSQAFWMNLTYAPFP